MDEATRYSQADQKSAYWDSFYADANPAIWPSQFAAFVLGEVDRNGAVVDVGCGGGRDTLFFASQKIRTVGIDGSAQAIRKCQQWKESAGLDSASFFHAAIDDPALPAQIQSLVKDVPARTIYARFFLHAIDEAGEDSLFRLAQHLCGPGDRFAVEYRTIRDAAQPKATPDHYRRFIEPATVVERATRYDFRSTYFVEGFGMAKYKNDDAYVARHIFARR